MKKKVSKTKIYEMPVIIEKDKKGYFFAICPVLQGCYTQGKSIEEALRNIREVIELHIEDRKEKGEELPSFKPVSLTSLEIKF